MEHSGNKQSILVEDRKLPGFENWGEQLVEATVRHPSASVRQPDNQPVIIHTPSLEATSKSDDRNILHLPLPGVEIDNV